MDTNSPLQSHVAPRFLFRFSQPVYRAEPIWSPKGIALDPSYSLIDLASLDSGTPNHERPFAEVRMAWSPKGLAFNAEVKGKKQLPWCRDSRLEDSDALEVWIDTRATHNIHRASKYCHRFVFLPAGGGRQASEPIADQLLINRARENARPVRPRELQCVSQVQKTGYRLSAFVPATALEGYDPANYRSLGFTYAVRDRELGLATFASGAGFPFEEDPSCWATLELAEQGDR